MTGGRLGTTDGRTTWRRLGTTALTRNDAGVLASQPPPRYPVSHQVRSPPGGAMVRRLPTPLTILIVLMLVLSACAPAATPTATTAPKPAAAATTAPAAT